MTDSRIQFIAGILQYNFPGKLNIYLYGSRVYGSFDKNSDRDFVIICKDNFVDFDSIRDLTNDLKEEHDADFHIFTSNDALSNLNQHQPMFIETLFLPTEFKLQESFSWADSWSLDKSKLRQSFSRVASNSWVKAKKKLTVEKDYDERTARKSLFHSFRLLDLAIQIVQDVKNPNFSSSNDILTELVSLPADWNLWDATFRSRHNSLQSKFREICPK